MKSFSVEKPCPEFEDRFRLFETMGLAVYKKVVSGEVLRYAVYTHSNPLPRVAGYSIVTDNIVSEKEAVGLLNELCLGDDNAV